MGMWAFEPWDNDEAADWYGNLMEETKLRKAWLKGINTDPEDSPETVRAAAALFVMLGRVYVWPIESYDQDLELAISALSNLAKSDNFEDVPELQSAITAELSELIARRKPSDSQAEMSDKPSRKPWWRF